MVEFYTGLKEQYNSETYAESIYQCTDTNETYVFGQKVNDVVNISNTSTDLNTLIPESGITYYYCENSAASQSLVNTPIKGGFILSCQRLVSSIVFRIFIPIVVLLTVNTIFRDIMILQLSLGLTGKAQQNFIHYFIENILQQIKEQH